MDNQLKISIYMDLPGRTSERGMLYLMPLSPFPRGTLMMDPQEYLLPEEPVYRVDWEYLDCLGQAGLENGLKGLYGDILSRIRFYFPNASPSSLSVSTGTTERRLYEKTGDSVDLVTLKLEVPSEFADSVRQTLEESITNQKQ